MFLNYEFLVWTELKTIIIIMYFVTLHNYIYYKALWQRTYYVPLSKQVKTAGELSFLHKFWQNGGSVLRLL